MDIAALIAWLATASGGVYLFGTWLSNGGMSRDGATTRFAPALIVGHAGLAVAGLVVWIAYLVSDESAALAWVALGLLVLVALLGFTMFARWLGDRRDAQAGASEIAEQRFPPVVVVGHGLLAVATAVLVFVAALQAT